MSNNTDPFEQLRGANPYVESGDLPPTTTSKSARFEEITMETPTATTPRTNPARPTPFWQNPRLAAPAAMAAAALVAVGALLASTVTAPSAQALVTEAAAQAATHDSGRMDLVVDFTDIPDGLPDFDQLIMQHQFDGENFDNTMRFEIDGTAVETLRTLRVDGTNYIEVSDANGASGTFEETGPDTMGLDPDTFGPDASLPILEQADDYEKTSSDDGVDVFTATVPTSVVLAIPEAELPPGLALLHGSDEDIAFLPETLLLELTVEDGQLTRMVVDVVAENDEMVDVTITTSFTELGQAQGIVAPATAAAG